MRYYVEIISSRVADTSKVRGSNSAHCLCMSVVCTFCLCHMGFLQVLYPGFLLQLKDMQSSILPLTGMDGWMVWNYRFLLVGEGSCSVFELSDTYWAFSPFLFLNSLCFHFLRSLSIDLAFQTRHFDIYWCEGIWQNLTIGSKKVTTMLKLPAKCTTGCRK